MKVRRKPTMFSQILLTTLIPVIVVFIIVIATIQSILNVSESSHIQESLRVTTVQISQQVLDKLQGYELLQNETSSALSGLDFSADSAMQEADALLNALISSDPDVYSTWFAFEPDVFPGGDRYYHCLLRTSNGLRDGITMTHAMLAHADWYSIPMNTGHVYYNMSEVYDYGFGEGPINVFTMARPIIKNGRIIGCLGIDVRYEDLFRLDNLVDVANDQQIMLLASDGLVLFSLNSADVGTYLKNHDIDNKAALTDALQKNELWIGETSTLLRQNQVLSILYPFQIQNIARSVFLYRSAPSEQIYGMFNLSMEVIYITGVLGVILLAFCVFIFTRGIVQHMKRITESFQAVTGGGIELIEVRENLPTAPTNIQELDILQSSLAAMMLHLRESHDLKMKSLATEVEKEKLIAASEAKSNFFASMSHEIRTPMNAILGISEIMLHEGDLTSRQEKHIRDIKTSSDSLLDIINDILDISKMESGKMTLHSEHYNFKAMLDKVVALSSYLASNSGLQFKYEATGDLPEYLYGDGIRVRQILLNLLGNAVKYTQRGFVRLNVYVLKGRLHFEVEDSGIGIKSADLKTVFDTFNRIDTRRNHQISGTGLGLSISRSLVELMCGTISVASTYGVGSIFHVELPMVLGDPALQLLPPTTSPVQRLLFSDNLRVLVVDDNEINLNVSSGLLKALFGIHCDTVNSGAKAIARVQEVAYDLIFMDHMMPDMDGVDTTRHIRSLGDSFRSLPIIALTANAVIGTRDQLLDAGMDDFLSKPIQSEQLRDVLYRWAPPEKRLISEEELPAEDSQSGQAVNHHFNMPDTIPPFEPEPDSRRLTPPQKVTDDHASPLIGQLKVHMPEIDCTSGLENIGYDEVMYLHSLQLLLQKLPQNLEQMESSLACEDLKDFQIYVHGLKGSLSSLGVAALSDRALNLEAASSRGDLSHCQENLSAFAAELADFHQRLSVILDNGAAAPSPQRTSGGQQVDAAAFLRLSEALESYDYEQVMEALGALLAMDRNAEENALLNEIKSLVDKFDYPSAMTLLNPDP